ncbi:hypothetical protein MVEN_02150500 [Mycena venus]|uniref:DUF6534 domain-containing protein n=1 Tax=Mycena venus TaxID=2733690 RepID=A0A8H6X9W2_9AGAR|nr:hypothetical protein MVEN_02150500 [Mycena venus]
MNSAIPVNLNTTLGAIQIGILASYVLFGVTTAQAYVYYSRFPDDSFKLKALIAIVWICELALTLCLGHTLYTYTISDYAQPERLLSRVPPSLGVAAFFDGFVALCVQGFFSYRLYAFTKTLYIPAVVSVLTFLQLLGTTVIFVMALRMTSMPLFVVQWRWLLTSTWAVTSVNDWVITLSLVAALISQRDYAQKRTVTMVNKLVLWTIETGMLTSLMSIVMMACFLSMKDNFIWIGLFTVQQRLFSNSLLASLNSRSTLRALNEVSLPSLHLASRVLSTSVNLANPTTQLVNDAEPEPALGKGKVAFEDV